MKFTSEERIRHLLLKVGDVFDGENASLEETEAVILNIYLYVDHLKKAQGISAEYAMSTPKGGVN